MMDEHKITRERGGVGRNSWIRPKCSCGWVGNKAYAFDEDQDYDLEEQEFDHKHTERAE